MSQQEYLLTPVRSAGSGDSMVNLRDLETLSYSGKWSRKHPEYARTEEKRVKQREASARYRSRHIELVRDASRSWHYENRDKSKVIHERWCRNNPNKLRSIVRKSFHKYRDSMREEILQMLGSKCKNCGNSNIIVLQIDHVNGGGSKERKRLSNGTNYYKHVLEELKSGSKEYQLLCANCNIMKAHQNHEQNIRRRNYGD